MANFESFSEDLIPRIVPQPMLHPVLDMSKPTVPEVSLIFDDSKLTALKNDAQPKTYKEWKEQQQKQQQQQQPKQRITNQIQSAIDRKKIVTFDLPIEAHPDKKLLPPPIETSTPMGICQQLDLSLCDMKKQSNNGPRSIPTDHAVGMPSNQPNYIGYVQQQNDRRMQMSTPTINNHNNNNNNNNDDVYQRISTQTNTQQMNINPNSAPSKDITLNEIYQLLQNMQINNNKQTPPVLNNESNELPRTNLMNHGLVNNQHHLALNPMPIVSTRFEHPANVPYSTSGEPTMKDMLNVILRQQEQLMNMQNQIHMLLMRTATPQSNQLESNPSYKYPNNITNPNEFEARTKQVGVMTSLEINVQNYNANGFRTDDHFKTPIKKAVVLNTQKTKQCGCICNCNAHQNSNSTDSGSNDEHLNTSSNPGETQTGWTFYGNILDQVNDVLQNTSPVTNTKQNEKFDEKIPANIEHRYSNSTDMPVPRQVRTAQFKQVGFQIDDVNISGMSKSMLMNALALKYLPCDSNNSPSPKTILKGVTQATANIRTAPTSTATTTTTTPPATSSPIINEHTSKRPNDYFDGKNLNTDMSITSYRYMEKYGLL